MSPFGRRRPGVSGAFSAPLVAIAGIIAAAVLFELLWAFGVIDLSRFRNTEPSTAGLIPVPTPGRAIPAYTRVTRDYLWDVRKNRLSVVYLPPRSVTKEMLTGIADIIGRVL